MKLKLLYQHQMPFRCNDAYKNWLMKKATQTGESMAGVIRNLIEAERQRENAFDNLLKPNQ
jgi:hypothetical protein